jgi:hypothetical protein
MYGQEEPGPPLIIHVIFSNCCRVHEQVARLPCRPRRHAESSRCTDPTCRGNLLCNQIYISSEHGRTNVKYEHKPLPAPSDSPPPPLNHVARVVRFQSHHLALLSADSAASSRGATAAGPNPDLEILLFEDSKARGVRGQGGKERGRKRKEGGGRGIGGWGERDGDGMGTSQVEKSTVSTG